MVEGHDNSRPSTIGLPAAIRRQRIQDLADARDFVRVADLSEIFGISEVTIRNDLHILEHTGALRRVHGGAVSIASAPRPESAFEESLGANPRVKQAIGEMATAEVVNGETIILDVGTTTTAMARALAARAELTNVTVFTNSLSVALELEAAIPRITVVVSGGTLRSLQHSLVDPLGGLIFDRVHVDSAFLGCNGVDVDGGITNVNLPEAEMKRRMMAAAKRTIVLADGSKLGRISTARLCPIADIDLLITGGDIEIESLTHLQESGLAIRIPDVPHIAESEGAG